METLYQPRLLYNDIYSKTKISFELDNCFRSCQTFDISVAFIASSGLAALKNTLIYLRDNNIRGRLITSTYLNFNDPKMFEELIKYKNIDVRIYQGKGFHPKGYIFKNNDDINIIVGSSNLTQSALSTNQEWNINFNSKVNDEIVKQITNEYEKQWNMSIPLTINWIENYKKEYIPINKPKPTIIHKIEPNYMQQNALNSLKQLRDNNKDKALLISATGTGKTYLSAFDVKNYQPKKMLFVVHRRSIAIKAMETFKNLIPNKKMGLFSGSNRDLEADYIFATIQTIYKKENRELFNKDYFDYIIIDEVHKAGANSYQELVDYFKPGFLLGMSATPERSDDFDIYQMFDYNIAYEIRLQQAMEYDLLCPFHYYGITDISIDNHIIDDKTEFNLLVDDKRVDYVIEKINDYGYSGNKVHGLIFVSRKEEAYRLSEIFNNRGYKTMALTGEASEKQRQEAMDSLESNDGLDYIFTVDIFNEGIDIPKVNQIVMLRPTESSIIFIQQLGRGLRKHQDKDYVVIIDFIGNYEKNFFIPIALSGNTNLNKDNLKRFVSEGNLMIAGESTIQFDEISKKRIFEAIDHANFNKVALIKESYQELKAKLGRIPKIKEFEEYGAIDIQKIFQNDNLGSYHAFLKKYEKDYKIEFNQQEEQYLKFISKKLSTGKRIQELLAIKLTIEKKTNIMNYLKEEMKNNYQIAMPQVSYQTIKNILTQDFPTGTSSQTFKDSTIIDQDEQISKNFNQLLNNNNFKEQVLEILDYAIDKYQKEYSNRYKDTDLCLYQKYTYEDVCRLLNYQQNVTAQNMGGYFYEKTTKTLPVFINYHKSEDAIAYADRFKSPDTLIALSKLSRDINSKDAKRIYKKDEYKDTTILLFVRKNKDDNEAKEFYFLGEIEAQGEPKEVTLEKKAFEIIYKLETPVRNDIYDYILNN